MAAKERIKLGAYTDEEIEEREKAKVKARANSLGRMESRLDAMEGYVPPSTGFAGTGNPADTSTNQVETSPPKSKKNNVECVGGGGVRCRNNN